VKLRLGSRWFWWRVSDRLTARDGYVDYEKGEVVVAAKYDDDLEELDTAVHEMIHGIDRDMKEKQVKRMGRQIAMGLLKLGWHRGR